METIYAFDFRGDTLLLRAGSRDEAKCRAFHEVVVEYGFEPDRLQELGWPSDSDVSRLDLSEPVFLGDRAALAEVG